MVGFEKALGAVKMIKDQIQYRSLSLLNLARGYFSTDSNRHYLVRHYSGTITLCDLSSRFFCIDATLLCEFESNKI